jgi:hypothetical protein
MLYILVGLAYTLGTIGRLGLVFQGLRMLCIIHQHHIPNEEIKFKLTKHFAPPRFNLPCNRMVPQPQRRIPTPRTLKLRPTDHTFTRFSRQLQTIANNTANRLVCYMTQYTPHQTAPAETMHKRKVSVTYATYPPCVTASCLECASGKRYGTEQNRNVRLRRACLAACVDSPSSEC